MKANMTRAEAITRPFAIPRAIAKRHERAIARAMTAPPPEPVPQREAHLAALIAIMRPGREYTTFELAERLGIPSRVALHALRAGRDAGQVLWSTLYNGGEKINTWRLGEPVKCK